MRYFTLALLVVALILASQGSLVLAIVLLIWAAYRSFADRETAENAIAIINWENRAKGFLFVTAKVREVLKDNALDKVFARQKQLTSSLTREAWIEGLLSNFKVQNNDPSEVIAAQFQLVNNQLLKDDIIMKSDVIYHSVFIPFVPNKEKDDAYVFTDTDKGISIRFFVVNGFIQLQVGRFSEEDSPRIIREGALTGIYEHYAILANFPLIYCCAGIPPKFLNLSFAATDAYKQVHVNSGKADKGKINDWRQINEEVRKYIELWKDSNSAVTGRQMKLLEEFNTKRNSFMEKCGFEKDKYGVHYKNRFMTLDFMDFEQGDPVGKNYSNWYEQS